MIPQTLEPQIIQELDAEVRAHLQKPVDIRREADLEELAARITEQNRHAEIDFGVAVGNESW